MMKKKQSKKNAPLSNGRSLNPDEAALWKSVTDNVKPLSNHIKTIKQPTPAQTITPTMAKEIKRPTNYHNSINEIPPKSDWRTARNLRKGKISVEARLDLHGMIQSEAHKALSGFINSSHETGRRYVLVITGKGRGGVSSGVLRSMTPRWLNQSPNRDKIISYTQAAPRDGGEGALYILLKKKRKC
ncbi:MAG TPA: hypothetical protein ENI79_01925 [Rhodospirillales bacterium]|nr:hypothetical protein [Rhodospirillales bacterium]